MEPARLLCGVILRREGMPVLRDEICKSDGGVSAQSVELRRHNTHLVTDDIVRLTGRPAVTLANFVAQNRHTFTPQGHAAE